MTVAVADVIEQAVGAVFTGSGYERCGLSWIWDAEGSFAGFSCELSENRGLVELSMRVGWRYDAFSDPPPEPRLAHGCVHSLGLDDLAGRGGLRRVERHSLGQLEQNLATTARKQLVRWVDSWKRPDGFRDFLSDRTYHLAAAWASALLGHGERAELELLKAGHLFMAPLDAGFDRRRADIDGAMAAAWSARNGLAAHLAEAETAVVDAFSSARRERAQAMITDPSTDHRRLQIRHDAFARTCKAYLRGEVA